VSGASHLALARRALVERINALGAACERETAQAYLLAPGRERDVGRLMLVDAGIVERTPFMDAVRLELGLPDPVVPSAREHSELSRRLYTARDLGTASDAVAGG